MGKAEEVGVMLWLVEVLERPRPDGEALKSQVGQALDEEWPLYEIIDYSKNGSKN